MPTVAAIVHPAVRPLAFALLCLIWGSTWLVIKVGYGGLGPFEVAAWRFLFAGLLLAIAGAVLVRRGTMRWPQGRAEWGVVAWVGAVLFAVDYGLVYWGEQDLDSGLTAVLFAVLPIFTAFAAHLYLPGERLTPRKLGGTLTAFAGVAALFADSLRVDAALMWPMLAIVASAVGAASGSVVTKRHGAALHPVALNGPAMLLGGGLLAVASFAVGDGMDVPTHAATWWSIAYLALAGSIVTFLVFFWLLKTWRATNLSFISVFTPLVAVALGAAAGEPVTPWMGLGTALILVGVLVAVRSPAPPRAQVPAPTPREE